MDSKIQFVRPTRENKVSTFQKRINSTIYQVSVYSSKTSAQTIISKIERIIISEMLNKHNNEICP